MKEITRRPRSCSHRKERGQSERGAIAQESFGVWKFHIIRCGPSDGASIATHLQCANATNSRTGHHWIRSYWRFTWLTNWERKKWETREKKNKSQNRHFAHIWAEKNSRRQTIFSNWNRRKNKQERLIANGKSNARNPAIVGGRETGSRKGGRGQKT